MIKKLLQHLHSLCVEPHRTSRRHGEGRAAGLDAAGAEHRVELLCGRVSLVTCRGMELLARTCWLEMTLLVELVWVLREAELYFTLISLSRAVVVY